eukprot:g3597.t1
MQDSGPKARTGRKRGRGNTAEQKVLRDMYAEARNSEMRNSLLLEQECLLNMQRVQSQKISEMTDEIQSLDPATQIFATKLVSASNADRNSMTNPEDVREREFNNTIKHYKEVLRRPLERFEAEERKKRKKKRKDKRKGGALSPLSGVSSSPATLNGASSKETFISRMEKDCFSLNAHIAETATSVPAPTKTHAVDGRPEGSGQLVDALLSVWQFFNTYSKTLGLRPPSVKLPLASIGSEAGPDELLGLDGAECVGHENVTLTSIETNERKNEQKKQRFADEEYQKYVEECNNATDDPKRRPDQPRKIIAKVRPRKMLSAGTPIVPLNVDAALDSSDSEGEDPIDMPPSVQWKSDLVPLLGAEPFALERFVSVLKDPSSCSEADQIWLDECHVRLLRPILVDLFKRLGQNTIVLQSSWWKDLRPRSLNAMTWPELARGLLCAIHYQDTAAMSRDAEVADEGGSFGIYDQRRPHIVCQATINCFECAPGRRAARNPSRKRDQIVVETLQQHHKSVALSITDQEALKHRLDIDKDEFVQVDKKSEMTTGAAEKAVIKEKNDAAETIADSLAERAEDLLSFPAQKNAEAGFECIIPTPARHLGSVAFRGSSGEGYGWQMLDSSQFWDDDDFAVLEAEKIRLAVSNASGGTATKKEVAKQTARIVENVGSVERILSLFSTTAVQSVRKSMREHVRNVRAALAAILAVRTQTQAADTDTSTQKSMVALIKNAVNVLQTANKAGMERLETAKSKATTTASLSSHSRSSRKAQTQKPSSDVHLSENMGDSSLEVEAESVIFSSDILAPINQLRLQLQRACSCSILDRPSLSSVSPSTKIIPISEIVRRMAHEACYEYHRAILRQRMRRGAKRGEDKQKLLMSEAILTGDIGLPSKKKSHKKKGSQKGRKGKTQVVKNAAKEAAKRADEELFAQEMANAIAAQRDAMRELQEQERGGVFRFSQDSVVMSCLSKEKALTPKMRFCERVYRRLLAEETDMVDSFCIPIDLGIYTDYKDFIRTPIDLRTIYERLIVGGYCSPEAFIADVELVFENCKTYCKGRYPSMVKNAKALLVKFYDILEQENKNSEWLVDTPPLTMQSPHFPLAIDTHRWKWWKLPNCDNTLLKCSLTVAREAAARTKEYAIGDDLSILAEEDMNILNIDYNPYNHSAGIIMPEGYEDTTTKTTVQAALFAGDQVSQEKELESLLGANELEGLLSPGDTNGNVSPFAREASGNARSARRKMNRGIRGIEARRDIIERKGVDGIASDDENVDEEGDSLSTQSESIDNGTDGDEKYSYDKERPWSGSEIEQKMLALKKQHLAERRQVTGKSNIVMSNTAGSRAITSTHEDSNSEVKITEKARQKLIYEFKRRHGPRPNVNSYIHFMKAEQEVIRDKIQTESADAANGSALLKSNGAALSGRIFAERWHQMSAHEKDPWIKRATADKQRYVKELQIFEKTKLAKFIARLPPAHEDSAQYGERGPGNSAEGSSDSISPMEEIAPLTAYNYYNYDADYSSDEDGYSIATSAKAKRRKAAKEKANASMFLSQSLALENADKSLNRPQGNKVLSSADKRKRLDPETTSKTSNKRQHTSQTLPDTRMMIDLLPESVHQSAAKKFLKQRAPQRYLNGYHLYLKQRKAEMVANDSSIKSGSGTSSAILSVQKHISQEWKALPKAEKKKWTDQSAEDQKIWEHDMLVFIDKVFRPFLMQFPGGEEAASAGFASTYKSNYDDGTNNSSSISGENNNDDSNSASGLHLSADSRKRKRFVPPASAPLNKKTKRSQKMGMRIKAMSAWGFFMKHRRGEIAQDGGSYGGMKAVMAQLAAEWKSMVPADRAKYDALAAADRIKTDQRKAEQNVLLAEDANAHAKEKTRREALGYEQSESGISFDETLQRWRVFVRWLGLKHFVAFCNTKAEAQEAESVAKRKFIQNDVDIRKSIFDNLAKNFNSEAMGYVAHRSFRVPGGKRGKLAKDRSSALKLEILQANDGTRPRPLFRVTNKTEPNAPVVEGHAIDDVWKRTVTMLEETLKKNGGASSSSSSLGVKAGENPISIRKSLNGLPAFGLMLPGVQDRLQGLKGVEKCKKYVWSGLSGIYGIKNTICGGKVGSGVVSSDGVTCVNGTDATSATTNSQSTNSPSSGSSLAPTEFEIPGFDCVTLVPAIKRLVNQTKKMRHDARMQYRVYMSRIRALEKLRASALAAKKEREKLRAQHEGKNQSEEAAELDARSIIFSKRFPSAMLLRFARIFDQRTSILESIHARVRMGFRDVQLGQDRFGNHYWVAGGNWARVLVHINGPPSLDSNNAGKYARELEAKYAVRPGQWFSVNTIKGLKYLMGFLLEHDHTEGPLRLVIQKLIPILLRTMKKTLAAQQRRVHIQSSKEVAIPGEYVQTGGLLGGLCPLVALLPQNLSTFNDDRQRVREALGKMQMKRERKRLAKRKELQIEGENNDEEYEIGVGEDEGDNAGDSSENESSGDESESESESESDLDSDSD